MPSYTWTGKSRDGLVKKGVIVAEDSASAMATLRSQAIMPTSVKTKGKDLKDVFPFLAPKVTTKDIVIFTRQFATMIDAGLPLVQCLDILGTQQDNPTFKRVTLQVKSTVARVEIDLEPLPNTLAGVTHRYFAGRWSIGFLTQDDAPIIWRGPMLHGAIQQFFREVAWKDLDYLIVDMPPGTGDVALSLSQTVPVVGSIVVTTPQQVSLSDSRRAVRMYQKLNIPTIGIVENMSYYTCTNCHHEADIFGHGGGEGLAAEMQVPFLGRLPIYQPIREGSDTGVPLVIAEPASPAAKAFLTVAERTAAQVSIAAYKTAEANRGKIPLIQVR